MADRKENEIGKVTSIPDGSYVRMLDAQGNSVQIDKSNFIKTIGNILLTDRYRILKGGAFPSYGWVKAYKIPHGRAIYLTLFQPPFSEYSGISAVVLEILIYYRISGEVNYLVEKKGGNAHAMINNSCSIAFKIENGDLYLYYPCHRDYGLYEQLIFNFECTKLNEYYSFGDVQELTLIPASGGTSF